MPLSGKKILIIEDDPSISDLVSKGLLEEHSEVRVAADGNTGVSQFIDWNPDLVILDIMLPGLNGMQVCAKIRERSQIPILMLTAMGTPENVALGLDAGADDYLTKPFKFIELIARVRSLIRRTEQFKLTDRAVYTFEDLEVDDEQKIVTRNGRTVSLTSTEYRLLLLFIQNPRKVFSRLEILEAVWEVNFELGTNVVDVYINYLRKKICLPGERRVIHTMIGMGYVMREES